MCLPWDLVEHLTESGCPLPLENGTRFEWGKSPHSEERMSWLQRNVGLYNFSSIMSTVPMYQKPEDPSSVFVMCIPGTYHVTMTTLSWKDRNHSQRKGCCFLHRWKWDIGQELPKSLLQSHCSVEFMGKDHPCNKCVREDGPCSPWRSSKYSSMKMDSHSSLNSWDSAWYLVVKSWLTEWGGKYWRILSTQMRKANEKEKNTKSENQGSRIECGGQ